MKKKIFYSLFLMVYSVTIINSQEKIAVPSMTDSQKQYRLNWILNYSVMSSMAYAKSLGKTAEDFAIYYGELAKKSWDPTEGFKGFCYGTLYNWVSFCNSSSPAVEILKQTETEFVFKAPFDVSNSIPVDGYFAVSFDELVSFYQIIFEEIAKYHGCKYKQKLSDDRKWMEITISK